VQKIFAHGRGVVCIHSSTYTENIDRWVLARRLTTCFIFIVYGAFDIESDDIYERAEQDWGLSQLGENGEEELPSLIIQSCWAHEYKHMFNEMQEWIQRGAGVVQMAILLKWTLEIPDPGADPVLHSEIEVFEYAPKTEAQYRRTFHEVGASLWWFICI